MGSSEPRGGCPNGFDYAQPTVTSGNSYVVPAAGLITSWSHSAPAGGGQQMTLKVFRKVAAPATYMAVGHEGPHALIPSSINTFMASIPVLPGDVLGLHTSSGINGCGFAAPGDGAPGSLSNLADGQSGDFSSPGFRLDGGRLNVTALLVPTNTFTLGKPKLNKKKGKATLNVEVPNAGTLVLGGKGVKGASAAGAVISKSVGAAGTVKLVIKAKGKQAKKLKRKGKVGLKAKITFTPTGGDPATQTKKLKLKRKLKRKKH